MKGDTRSLDYGSNGPSTHMGVPKSGSRVGGHWTQKLRIGVPQDCWRLFILLGFKVLPSMYIMRPKEFPYKCWVIRIRGLGLGFRD